MLKVYGDRDAMRWVGDGEPLDEAGCRHWIEVTHNNYRKRGYGMSALVLRSSDAVIGFCGLVHPGNQADAEIKYALKREYWGRGYATEAVMAMLTYGQQEKRLDKIIATIAPENTPSKNVLVKAGMRPAELIQDEDGSSTQLFVWP